MFSGWLKGILSSILIWLGLTFIVYGFYLLGDERSGTTSLIIGAILGVA